MTDQREETHAEGQFSGEVAQPGTLLAQAQSQLTATSRYAWLGNRWGATAIIMAAYVLLFLVWTIFHWGGEEKAALVSDVAYLPVNLFASVCAWKIAWGRGYAKKMRWAWFILGMAMFSNFLADIAWFYYETILQVEPFPSLANVFHLAYYPLALLGLLALPVQASGRGGRLKFGLDLMVVLVSAWLPIWHFLVVPMAERYGGQSLMQVLAAAYPVGDLILLTGLAAMLMRQPEKSTRRALGWIFGGLVIWLAGDLIYSYQSLADTYMSGRWVGSTWLLGNLFLGLAALRSAHSYNQEVEHEQQVFALERFSRQIPFVSSALAYILVVTLIVTGLNQGRPMIDLLAGSALLTGLVMMRQLVEIGENQRLTVDLQKINQQIQLLTEEFEHRGREREQEINLAAAVARQLSELRDLETLLGNAVSLIQERFNLYHTQIYLLDPGKRELVLRTGTGPAGVEMLRRKHRLVVNLASINGSAAVEKRTVIVENTENSKLFKPNPLLPGTRSEMAVPLLVGDEVVGVLDMQSKKPGAFSRERLPVFEAMAGQLAIAIHNASLFSEVDKAREEVAAHAWQLTQTHWQNFQDGIAQPEYSGYLYRAGTIQPLREPSPDESQGSRQEVPITVSGGQIGKFVFDLEEQVFEEDLELVRSIARQVAQQAENLRLLDQTERYRLEAERAARKLLSQGWEAHLSGSKPQPIAFVYDQNEVTPWETNQGEAFRATFSEGLKIQGMEIGELAVAGADELGEDGAEILAVVAERLSAHLENLRLFASAQRELAERQRAQEALIKFRLGIEQTTDAVFITDTQGEIIYVNPAFEQVYGYSSEEALGKTPRIIKSGLISQEQYQQFWAALLDKQVVAGEIINKHKDGRLIPIEGANTPIVDEQGVIIGFLALHRDISDRKQAQENLTKRATELETVAKLSTHISAMSDPLQIIQNVVDQAKEAFGLYHAHIYELDERRQILVLAAGAGTVGRQMAAQGWEIPLEREHSLVVQAARSHKGLISNDVTAEANFLPNPLLPDTQAEMAIPIMAGEKLLGVLDVQSEQAGRFTQEDVNIQTTLASQVAVALENARLFQQVQYQAEYEAMINTISQKIQGTTTVEGALQVAIRELGRALGAERTSVHLNPSLTAARKGAKTGNGSKGNGKANPAS
ncbi:MAG TPA: GAF domain-containing protein [Anaerolineales bacterium]|nr:GAF domain-containing protein [Anaerolineales bacterium]